MLKTSSLTFLRQLKRPANKTKAWVDEHRVARDAAVLDFTDLAEVLLAEVSKFDEGIRHARLAPKDCVTRLNRDVRFHGGPAFKHDVHLVFNARGKKRPGAFFYVHVEPGNSCAGGGVYNPETADLAKFRAAISGDFGAFQKMIKQKSFTSALPHGVQSAERVKTVPRGFDADDPAVDFLKMKGIHTREPLADKDLTQAAGLKKIVKILKASAPLVNVLNEALRTSPTGRASKRGNPQYPR